MSGPFGSQQWMYSSGFYPHEIGNSARFDTNSYIARTPSSAGNRKTFTWSAWVKRCKFSTNQTFFSAGSSSSSLPRVDWQFITDDKLQLYFNPTGSTWIRGITTTASYRDPSAWYHIVAAIDTTQASGADRVKLYVNGEQITAFTFGAYLTQDSDMPINNTIEHNIGRYQSDANAYFDGYIAEVNFVDGTALTPASFGETKADTWIPKKYTGSYGTNGYYLDFATRATDPIDASGQGNNWSSTNVASTDWMLDSPTNNFATINPLATPDNNANISFSQGNLRVDNPASNYGWGDGTIPLPKTGKWVFEVLFLKTPTGASPWCYNSIGVITDTQWGSYATNGSIFYGIDDSGGTYKNFVEAGTAQGTHAGFPAGTVVQVFADRDNNQLTFSINGTLQTQTDSTVDIPAGVDLVPATGNYEYINIINFGQDSSFAGEKTAQGNTDANGRGDFHYAPPAGYLALCTANLPDPAAAFNPAVNNSPQDHFNTKLYTGNGSTNNITGVGFQPDFVWIKSRSEAYWHRAFDVLRGATKQLYPNDRAAEATESTSLTAFGSDGFTLGSFQYTNNNTTTFASWNWKAGGSGSSNSDGTITSTVSANTDSGFSIVTYTGNGSASATVGHGLGATPAMVIVKCRNSGADDGEWTTAHQGISGQVVFLNQSLQAYNPAVFQTGGVALGNSSAFSFINGVSSVDNSNKSGNTYVAYCFAEKEGFSKFGTFAGNGSADGPFIYTGFRPAFVICKKTSSTGLWVLTDNKRKGYNVNDEALFADDMGATSSGAQNDFTSNGFKLRATGGSVNTSGDTFIYIAFAEMPFKYANAR